MARGIAQHHLEFANCSCPSDRVVAAAAFFAVAGTAGLGWSGRGRPSLRT